MSAALRFLFGGGSPQPPLDCRHRKRRGIFHHFQEATYTDVGGILLLSFFEVLILNMCSYWCCFLSVVVAEDVEENALQRRTLYTVTKGSFVWRYVPSTGFITYTSVMLQHLEFFLQTVSSASQ